MDATDREIIRSGHALCRCSDCALAGPALLDLRSTVRTSLVYGSVISRRDEFSQALCREYFPGVYGPGLCGGQLSEQM